MNEPQPAETESPALPPPASAAKLARLRRKSMFWRRVHRFMLLTPLICLPIPPIVFALFRSGIVPYILVEIADKLWASLILLFFLWIPTWFWRNALEEYQGKTDLQAIGLIVEGLPVSDLRGFTMEILTKMLPRLQSSDAHRLTPHHHSLLNRVLSRNNIYFDPRRTAFKIAILKAYEQVGGTEDLPTVERLAQGKGYARKDKHIREAAQECLPYLQARY